MDAECRGARSIAYLERFVKDVGHLVLKVLRCGEGTSEEERASSASVDANPDRNISRLDTESTDRKLTLRKRLQHLSACRNLQ